MPRSIVIVHGWSDDSKSFRRLAEQLEAWFGSAPTQIRLADWISCRTTSPTPTSPPPWIAPGPPRAVAGTAHG